MVYLKSLVAGMAALAMAAALAPILMGIYFYIVYRPGASEAVGWDPTSFARQPQLWVITAAIFMTGFIWEFRRAHLK
jgi:hypothetical protein